MRSLTFPEPREQRSRSVMPFMWTLVREAWPNTGKKENTELESS